MQLTHDEILAGITVLVRDYEIARNIKRCLDTLNDETKKKIIWAASLDNIMLYYFSAKGVNGMVKVRGKQYDSHIVLNDGEWV